MMPPPTTNNVRLLNPEVGPGSRQAVLLTPPRSSHPSRLLSRQHFACANPLAATLMHLPASVANKRFTARLSPLAATLTKKTGYLLQAKSFSLFFFPVLSSTPLGASEPLRLPLRLPSSVHSPKFRILQSLCLQLLRKHRGCGGILPISTLIARNSSELFQQHTCGGGGTLIPYFITSLLPYLAASSSHESPVTIRCIIPPREHPSERSRMPGPGLPHRKRNHHSRILSTCPERPRQRLQPEIEPRSDHDARRSRRPPSPSFSGR